MDSDRKCGRCGCAETDTVILGHGVHHAKEVCSRCGAYVRFLPRPDAPRPRRRKSHTELVNEYGNGYCELCGILQERIPRRESLEAHHVVEYRSGGPKERENIWIVCTACHRLIHWRRTHLKHIFDGGQHAVDKSTGSAQGPESVDQLEDRPPWE